jgi:hypothetical protein
MKKNAFFLLTLICCQLSYSQTVIHVATDGNAESNGSSWENATTLSQAASLSAQTSGAQIRLKAGTYYVVSPY